MSDKKPNLRFSVVIPAFNESAYLGRALESLKLQTYPQDAFEVIVVDNNSTDDTALLASRLGAKVVSEKKVGVCSARQAGTKVARGEIIISTDADTTFPKNWLESFDKAYQKHPKALAVSGSLRFHRPPIWGFYIYILFGLVGLYQRLTRRVWYVSACNLSFKKTAWEAAGEYNTSLTQAGDELDLLRRLKKQGRIVFKNKIRVVTSSRRLREGFLYNFIVSLLIFYLGDYYLSRLTGRSILGSVPSIRENEHWQTLKSYKRQAVMVVTFLLAVFVFFAIQPDLIHEIRHRHLPNINKSIRQTTEKWLDYF